MKTVELKVSGKQLDPTRPMKLKSDAKTSPNGFKVTILWNKESKKMDKFPNGTVYNNVTEIEWLYDKSIRFRKKPLLHLDAPLHSAFGYPRIDWMEECKIEVQKKLEKSF